MKKIFHSINILRLIVICFFLIFAFCLVQYRPDDVFIFFRYAENIANGYGVVYNQGEYVEGVTSILWTVMLTGLAILKLPLEFAAPLLSLLISSFTLWKIFDISARLRGRGSIDKFDLWSAMLILAFPPFIYWAYSGMETALFTLYVVIVLDLHTRNNYELNMQNAMIIGSGVLIRPEALLIIFSLFGYYLFFQKTNKPSKIFFWLFCAMIIPFALFLFRKLYFGAWLPNTYYAKNGAGFIQTILFGLNYLIRFLADIAPITSDTDINASCGMTMFVIFGIVASKRISLRFPLYLVSVLIAGTVIEGGDWMVAYRFLVPTIPLICLIIVSFAGQYNKSIATSAFLTFTILHILNVAAEVQKPTGRFVTTVPDYSKFIKYLNNNSSKGESIALMDIGEIGYKTKLHVIDISGLTEPVIAHSKGGFLTKDYPVDLILDQKPLWIALREGFYLDKKIFENERFKKNYQLVLEEKLPAQMALYKKAEPLL